MKRHIVDIINKGLLIPGSKKCVSEPNKLRLQPMVF